MMLKWQEARSLNLCVGNLIMHKRGLYIIANLDSRWRQYEMGIGEVMLIAESGLQGPYLLMGHQEIAILA